MPLKKKIVSKRYLRRKIERKLKTILANCNNSKNDLYSCISTQLNSKDKTVCTSET